MTDPTPPKATAAGAAGRTALWVIVLTLVVVGTALYLRYANAVTPLVGTAG
jgi:hypothetical protein